jgi:hypothetical protein
MNYVLLLQPHLIQTDKVQQLSSENVSVQAAIRTPRTSNQHHEAVLPEIFSGGKKTPAYHGTQRFKTSYH